MEVWQNQYHSALDLFLKHIVAQHLTSWVWYELHMNIWRSLTYNMQ